MIEAIEVKENFRRKGLATVLINHFKSHPTVARACPHLFAWPAPNRRLDSAELHEAAEAAMLLLFRKCGFRRVGRTSWLAFALDPTHPSHLLPVADDPSFQDFEPPVQRDADCICGKCIDGFLSARMANKISSASLLLL
jgi:hypothetical protein